MQDHITALSPPEFIDWLFTTVTNTELNAYRVGREWQGSFQNYQRLAHVAEYCAVNYPGDLAEIGCLRGEATRLFCAVARKHNRRVICVDPWDYKPGDPYYDPDVDYYKIFCNTVTEWSDIVDVIRASSLDPVVIESIKNRQLCFAYQDGLHTYEGVTSDLDTLTHCAGIIAVDDVIMYDLNPTSNAHTRRAFYEGAVTLRRLPMAHYLCREWYLLPPREVKHV